MLNNIFNKFHIKSCYYIYLDRSYIAVPVAWGYRSLGSTKPFWCSAWMHLPCKRAPLEAWNNSNIVPSSMHFARTDCIVWTSWLLYNDSVKAPLHHRPITEIETTTINIHRFDSSIKTQCCITKILIISI